MIHRKSAFFNRPIASTVSRKTVLAVLKFEAEISSHLTRLSANESVRTDTGSGVISWLEDETMEQASGRL